MVKQLIDCRRPACLQVHFGRLEGEVVEALVDEGAVMACAGALMVEHALVAPRIARMHGALDSVQGLPKALLLRLLQRVALGEGQLTVDEIRATT